MRSRKKFNIKKIVVLLISVFLIGGTVGGTLAWLIVKTDSVKNTFSAANINITLTETPNADSNDPDSEDDIWIGKMVPGTAIKKDPVVTVEKNSESCWLFVKIEETESDDDNITTGTAQANTYITYLIRTGENDWKALDGHSGIYYREVSTSTSDQSFYVLVGEGDGELKNGCVHVPNTVSKAMLDDLEEGSVEPLSLTFTAYAVQKEGIDDVSEAWNQASSLY